MTAKINLPTLYHKGKNGELRQWTVWADGADVVTEHGLVGGKLQTSSKRAEPKNVGRSNATTAEQQAKLEAESQWEYKVTRKYSKTKGEAKTPLFLPMLAHEYKGAKKKNLVFPCALQPKMDGCRALASRGSSGKIELISRSGRLWNIPHIEAKLDKWLPEGVVLDGELYIHGESCQYITSLCKSTDPAGKSYKPESLELDYHVYDMPSFEWDDSLTFFLRWRNLVDNFGSLVTLVDTIRVKNESEAMAATDLYVREGYEGSMLRSYEGIYLWGYRSADLLKVKSFEDGEFKVIGADEGEGKMKGAVVWKCKNDKNSETFDCAMKAPIEVKRDMWANRASYIDQYLTVRYFGRTDASIPRFPRGIVFRAPEDK